MVETSAVITRDVGLDVRAATTFAKTASAFEAGITLALPERGLELDGKDPDQLAAAGIEHDTEVLVIADGPDEEEAMAALIALIECDFGEG